MKICLKTYAKQERHKQIPVHLSDRLPVYVQSPCELQCDLQVEAHKNYYLLMMKVQGTLLLTCQRCLGDFSYHYENETKLIVCPSDAIAEQYMDLFECIVSSDGEVDLIDILTDDLYLFCPEKHEDPCACDSGFSEWIEVK